MQTTKFDVAQVGKTANFLRRFVLACYENAGVPLLPHEPVEPSSNLDALATLCPGLPDRIGVLVDAAEHLRLEVSERELSRLRDKLRWILRDEPDSHEIVRKCFNALFRLPPAVERLERAGDAATPMTAGQARLWDALSGRCLTARTLADEDELDTSEDTVRQWVQQLRHDGYDIECRRGRGYYRPDAPAV